MAGPQDPERAFKAYEAVARQLGNPDLSREQICLLNGMALALAWALGLKPGGVLEALLRGEEVRPQVSPEEALAKARAAGAPPEDLARLERLCRAPRGRVIVPGG